MTNNDPTQEDYDKLFKDAGAYKPTSPEPTYEPSYKGNAQQSFDEFMKTQEPYKPSGPEPKYTPSAQSSTNWQYGDGNIQQPQQSKFKKFIEGVKSVGAGAGKAYSGVDSALRNLTGDTRPGVKERTEEKIGKVKNIFTTGIDIQAEQEAEALKRQSPIWKQAEPEIKAKIMRGLAQKKGPKYPENPTKENIEKYQKDQKSYENWKKSEFEKRMREFEASTPLQKTHKALKELHEKEKQQHEVQLWMQKREQQKAIRKSANEPSTRFLGRIIGKAVGTKQKGDFVQKYGQSGLHRSLALVQNIDKSQQKKVPVVRFDPEAFNAPNTVVGKNPIGNPYDISNNQQSRGNNLWENPQPIIPQSTGGVASSNTRMVPPAYNAPNPFLAPPEYPPFGDNPVRNFAEANMDHPLFQTNKTRSEQKFIW